MSRALALVLLLAAPAALLAQQAPPLATQPVAQQPGAAAADNTPPEFRLDTAQQAYLDQALDLWERESGKVQTFSCDFTRLVYDKVFGPQGVHKNEEDGTVSYQQPDKGSFQIKTIRSWDAEKQAHVPMADAIGEHWVCDGKSVYEYKHAQKQLVERPIPPEMQGKRIVDGPLPFLFGAEAAKLKRRYWMRVDPRAPAGSIWLVAQPKFQADAANYRRVELMFNTQKMLPGAMRVTRPDTSQVVYTFKLDEAKINSRMTQLWNTLFQSPRTPYGWQKIVEAPNVARGSAPGAAR